MRWRRRGARTQAPSWRRFVSATAAVKAAENKIVSDREAVAVAEEAKQKWEETVGQRVAAHQAAVQQASVVVDETTSTFDTKDLALSQASAKHNECLNIIKVNNLVCSRAWAALNEALTSRNIDIYEEDEPGTTYDTNTNTMSINANTLSIDANTLSIDATQHQLAPDCLGRCCRQHSD